jgi:gluconate 5-dehydrogenase
MLGLRDRGYSAYCSTKGGLALLVRQHAVELARHRITVNGVAPTVVRTPMASHWLTNPATATAIVERIPLRRVGEPEDVVGAVLFFCAPASDFITGQVLYADGGLTATQ